MRIGILLVLGGMGLLAGCGSQAGKTNEASIPPKWKGAPYRIAFDAKAAKPNPAGVTIPSITYTADPESLERRAVLVVHFDVSGSTKNTGPMVNQMIMSPFDISGAEGTLPADYLDSADKDLARFLGAYCVKGKIKISVRLVRSSIGSNAGDAEVDAKSLSDWLPVEVEFKNPHPKC